MSEERIQFGGCSFIPPEGFVVEQNASLEKAALSNSEQCCDRTNRSICITLISTAVHPDVPDYSDSPDDMTPDAYPATLTLTTFPGQRSVSPLAHLRNTEKVLKDHLQRYQIDYLESETIGGSLAAARSQSSFVTNFRIFRLNYAWAVNGVLFTSTMTVTESGVEKGWTDLRRFVDSVRF